jgi:uncharacterized repeat protein (TIGR03803 family)
LLDVGGTLFGTTTAGGDSNLCSGGCGTIFSANPAGLEEVLSSFSGYALGGPDGAGPSGALVDDGGMLYGTTAAGGANGLGTVFAVTPSGVRRLLHTFRGSDGANPMAALLPLGGTLYGTTNAGGTSKHCGGGCGTVFAISTTGAERVIYSFTGGDDGQRPSAALIYADRSLYGTTSHGGDPACGTGSGCGTIFSIDSRGAEHVLHRFSGRDGTYPIGALTEISGTLYGTTSGGGSSTKCGGGCGTVFSATLAGAERVLYSFTGSSDGARPYAGLLAVNGTLYGTTLHGGGASCGGFGCGTVFSIAQTGGPVRIFHSFSETDGANPEASLIDVGGTLFGTTQSGGTTYGGTVFAISP